jgi:hypothetical protein
MLQALTPGSFLRVGSQDSSNLNRGLRGAVASALHRKKVPSPVKALAERFSGGSQMYKVTSSSAAAEGVHR